jgi:hypothetical protein
LALDVQTMAWVPFNILQQWREKNSGMQGVDSKAKDNAIWHCWSFAMEMLPL